MSCKEQYIPEANTNRENILVVEGFINTGQDSTFIRLSRTVLVTDKEVKTPESGAVITVESDLNEKFVLTEQEKGIYASAPLNLSPLKKYRINIKTVQGATYQSDFVETKVSPSIDSVSYEIKQDGVQLFVSTKDVTNQTRYYRWEYEDTWIFFSKLNSSFIYRNRSIIPRQPAEDIYQCWGNGASSTIYLGSSAKLKDDIIFLNPITFIPSTSEKLELKYSILVKQYALTKEAYEFWQSLKKNTESLGSIFDSQPSQLTGNIHNLGNANEPVIGYISAGSITKKRFFLSKDSLPKWEATYPFDDCYRADPVLFQDLPMYFEDENNIPTSEYLDESGKLIGYYAGARKCVDCTIRGTTKRPSFWQ
ncbi:MAG: DUF4249 domain-containing protein [Bacteroidota bacterium]